MGVSSRTAYQWLSCYRAEGEAGLQNRSSRPRQYPHATPVSLVCRVTERRRQTYRQIALAPGLSQSTLARLRAKAELNRLSHREPAKPDHRSEYAAGDLRHINIKTPERFKRPEHRVTGERGNQPKPGSGWGSVPIAVDDHSRGAFCSIHADETAKRACEALRKTGRDDRGLGIGVKRVLTDRDSPVSKIFKRLGTRGWGGCTRERDPIAPEPMEKWSDLYRPLCGNGPMLGPMDIRAERSTTAPMDTPVQRAQALC